MALSARHKKYRCLMIIQTSLLFDIGEIGMCSVGRDYEYLCGWFEAVMLLKFDGVHRQVKALDPDFFKKTKFRPV